LKTNQAITAAARRSPTGAAQFYHWAIMS